VLEGVFVVEVHGSLFFGNAGPLQRKLAGAKDAEAIVLHMGDVRYLDQSGVYALADLADDLSNHGTRVYVAELQSEPRQILGQLGVIPEKIPEERVFDAVQDAITVATKDVHSGSGQGGDSAESRRAS
jgi:SulP family sulfate permease